MSCLTFEQQKQLLLIETQMKEKTIEPQNLIELSKRSFVNPCVVDYTVE